MPLMSGLLYRPVCFLMYFIVITCAWMPVYVTSSEAVWALRPRGSSPCSPELRARLLSLELWTTTRLIHTTTGWRPVLRRGCRAGRRVYQQRLTSVSVSVSPSRIPVIVGRRSSANQQSTTLINNHRRTSATRCRRRRTSQSRQSVLRTVPLCRQTGQQVSAETSDVTRRPAPYSSPAPSLYVLNAAALTKPHAVEQLAADLQSYDTDIAVITESHLKSKHIDNVVAVSGYTLLR